MTLVYSIDKFAIIVTGVGQCVYDALDGSLGGTPNRYCPLTPGEVAWDLCDCGLLTQSIGVSGPGLNFPTISDTIPFHKCGPPLVVVEVKMTLVRCVARPSDTGKPPKCDALLHDALVMEHDRFIMRDTVSCCLKSQYDNVNITAFTVGRDTPVGPQGGCAGIELGYTFAVTSNFGCCAGA